MTLFFATNRNHLGKDRWHPTGYGQDPSGDGKHNLRFGELDLETSTAKVNKFLAKGDGESLSGYLSKCAKKAKISAYVDMLAEGPAKVPLKKLSSIHCFQKIKKLMTKSNDVLIYVHGFNVSWEDAVGGAMALQLMLNRKKEEGEKGIVVFLFSWPSDGSMLPFLAYRSDRKDAKSSSESFARGMLKLRDFLHSLSTNSTSPALRRCNQQLHLLCHSMGNYVLQNVLPVLEEYNQGNKLPAIFKNIFMCAPDVDDDVLGEGKEMERLHELTKYITVYFNREDTAMYISDYTKGQANRLGQDGSAYPVNKKVHQVDCTPVITGLVEHSYYLWDRVNDDIRYSIDDMATDSELRVRKRAEAPREWIFES